VPASTPVNGSQCLDRNKVSPMGGVLLLLEELDLRRGVLLVLCQQSVVLTDL
jgi:hypothetical protein